MFSSILVPVDGTEPSDKALTFALGLAATQNAEVFLCHVPVRSKVNELGARIPFSRSAAESHWDDALRVGQSILDAARYRADEFGVRAKAGLGAGSPADGIIEVAEREGVDLIVMGSHGYEGPIRTLISSTTEAVIRRAPVPVVVIGPDAAWVDVCETASCS
jgi:nucleotide-binding universal stress UspA family protein